MQRSFQKRVFNPKAIDFWNMNLFIFFLNLKSLFIKRHLKRVVYCLLSRWIISRSWKHDAYNALQCRDVSENFPFSPLFATSLSLSFLQKNSLQLFFLFVCLFHRCVFATGFPHALTRLGSCEVGGRPRAQYLLDQGPGEDGRVEHHGPLPLRALRRDLAVGGQVQGVAQVAVRVRSI